MNNSLEVENVLMLDAMSRMLEPDRENLPGEPIRVVTIEDTDTGFRFRDYTKEDAELNRFRIDIYKSPLSGGLGEAKNIAQEMAKLQNRMTGDMLTVALASDRTHTSISREFTMLPAMLQLFGVDLSRFHFTHLDNYIWDPAEFPKGPNKYDFARVLRKNIINRLIKLGLPKNHFHPIEAMCSFDEASQRADEIQKMWDELTPDIIAFGLGKEPEVHLGYIPPGGDENAGFSAVKLSGSTNERNLKERKEKVPVIAITIGKANVASVPRRFVSAWGSDYAERIKILFSQRPSDKIIASMLLTPDLRNGTVFSLDLDSATYILEQMQKSG